MDRPCIENARHRAPLAVDLVAAVIGTALAKGWTMGNDFLAATRSATRGLAVGRSRHVLWRKRSETKFARAKARHEVELVKASAFEADAWRLLLAIPGMTVGTASVMTGIDQAEVTRWARKINETGSRPTSAQTGAASA